MRATDRPAGRTLATISQSNRANRSGALGRLSIAVGMPDPDIASTGSHSFSRQDHFFALLNLFLIGGLLGLQVVSHHVRGRPAASVIIVLVIGFAAQGLYLIGLRIKASPFSARQQRISTYWSIGLNSALALTLTSLTIRGDTAYYALMLLPILEAAFRLGLGATVGIIFLADLICFLGAWGMKFGEYIEAGAMSVIYAVMGLLVWLLVNSLHEREQRLLGHLRELEGTRQELLSKEKLAAVGRLSRAIAHEIRNPVAMISSSLATAMRPEQSELERQEMFAIAAKEATRLERLTGDLLVYAGPHAVRAIRARVSDLLNYVATLARAHASDEGVKIDVDADASLEAEFDAEQIQQAVLNLLLNAIDACEQGDAVQLRASGNGGAVIKIDVIDSAGPIPQETVLRIFEPLFTTKQNGNGLGLAIARNIARAHGGDVILKTNLPGQVCFSIEIPAYANGQEPPEEF